MKSPVLEVGGYMGLPACSGWGGACGQACLCQWQEPFGSV